MWFKGLFFLLFVSLSCLAKVRIGYNERYPSALKARKDLNLGLRNGDVPSGLFLKATTLDSELLTKFINLQLEAVILPLSEFQKIYQNNSIQSFNKAMILPTSLSLEVGFFRKAGCGAKDSLKNVKIAYLIKESPEFYWLQLRPEKNQTVHEVSFFEMLEKLQDVDLGCKVIAWGTSGHTRFLNDTKVLFTPLGSIPLWLFANERSLRFQEETYIKVSRLLALSGGHQMKESRGQAKAIDMGILKGLIIDYNFRDEKFEENKLNELIKVF